MHELNAPTGEVAPFKEDLNADSVELPAPSLPRASLASALGAVVRAAGSSEAMPIPLAQLGDLLHGAYGVLGTIDLWGEFCERPAPSGGALYPLELYV